MPVPPQVARSVRSRLRIAVRGVWDSEEGIALRDALADEAYASKYAERLAKEAEALGLSNRFRTIAKEVEIGKRYRTVYAKPTA